MTSSLFLSFFSLRHLLLFLFLALIIVDANGETRSHHKVNISSLLPRKVCSNSKGADAISNVTRLRLVHRRGPCSPAVRRRRSNFHAEILAHDQLRVGFLRQRIAAAELGGGGTSPASAGAAPSTKIPARSGASVSAGDYIVTVGLGTPPTAQTVFLDTGSDVTWVQCRPCSISCHRQLDPLFDPASSATYANVTCASAACSDLDVSGCSGGTCLYGVAYGDGSQSIGFYSSDALALALTPADVVPRFLFGCGQDNEGLFGRAAGILGLGGGRPSLVAQTMNKYNGVFGYCLPASSSDDGYLAFGDRGIANPTVKYTNMLRDAKTPTFYFLNLIGISVAGQRLRISPSVFAKAGTLIDSGTVITRLPPKAYTSLRSAFRRGMSRYKRAPAVSILDTCYDPTGREEVNLPAVALQFAGDVSVNLAPEGIVYAVNESRICLAFAANEGDGDVGILGNVQQRTFAVVYDVPKKLIGFAAEGC